MLANLEEVKNRRGHKTDRKNAEHLADLLRHNHVRSSYIPAEYSVWAGRINDFVGEEATSVAAGIIKL